MSTISAGLVNVQNLSVTGTSAGAVSATNFKFTNLDVSGGLTAASVSTPGNIRSSTLDVSGNLSVGGNQTITGDLTSTTGAIINSDLISALKTLKYNAQFQSLSVINSNLSNVYDVSGNQLNNIFYSDSDSVYKFLDGTKLTPLLESNVQTFLNYVHPTGGNAGGAQFVKVGNEFGLQFIPSLKSGVEGRADTILRFNEKFDPIIYNVDFTPAYDYSYITPYLEKYKNDSTSFIKNITKYNQTGSQFFSNSGILFGDSNRHEVQILDSYLAGSTETRGSCGSLYNTFGPLNIANKPFSSTATGYNKFNVMYDPARVDSSNNMLSPSYFTVFLNNILVQYRCLPWSSTSFTVYNPINQFPSDFEGLGLQVHSESPPMTFLKSNIVDCPANSLTNPVYNSSAVAQFSSMNTYYRNKELPEPNEAVYSDSNGILQGKMQYRTFFGNNRVTFSDFYGNIDYLNGSFPNDAVVITSKRYTIYGSYQLNIDTIIPKSIDFGDGYTISFSTGNIGKIYKNNQVVANPLFHLEALYNVSGSQNSNISNIKLVYTPKNVLHPYYLSTLGDNCAEVTVLINNRVAHKYLRLPDTLSTSLNVLSFSSSLSGWYRTLDNLGLSFVKGPILETAPDSSFNNFDKTKYTGPVVGPYFGPNGMDIDFDSSCSGYITLKQTINIDSSKNAVFSLTGNTEISSLPANYKTYCYPTIMFATTNDILNNGTIFNNQLTDLKIPVGSLDLSNNKYRMYTMITDLSNGVITKPIYNEFGNSLKMIAEYGTSMYTGIPTDMSGALQFVSEFKPLKSGLSFNGVYYTYTKTFNNSTVQFYDYKNIKLKWLRDSSNNPLLSTSLSNYTTYDTSGAWVGTVALISRGINTFADKMFYANQAGCIGYIIYNNIAGGRTTGNEYINLDVEPQYNQLYPYLSITYNSAQTIINQLKVNPNLTVDINDYFSKIA